MPGSLGEQSAVRSLHFGDVRLTYVVDGAMAMWPQRFFPDIPADYWAAHPDELDPDGKVAMSAGGLLVERDGRALLIDVGLGATAGPVLVGEEAVGITDSGDFLAILEKLDIAVSQVEVVAFTHLHVDHTGWAFRDGGKVFPGARYLVAAQEWAPHERGEAIPGAPSRAEVIDPLAGAHTTITSGAEIFPGVHAVVTPGHSPGHTTYTIAAGEQRIVAAGDVFHIPAQVRRPEWASRPDSDRAAVQAARAGMLEQLRRADTIGFCCHFGDQVFGRVVTGADGHPVWKPVHSTVLLPSPRSAGAAGQ